MLADIILFVWKNLYTFCTDQYNYQLNCKYIPTRSSILLFIYFVAEEQTRHECFRWISDLQKQKQGTNDITDIYSHTSVWTVNAIYRPGWIRTLLQGSSWSILHGLSHTQIIAFHHCFLFNLLKSWDKVEVQMLWLFVLWWPLL